jgi:hypothetical protein
VKQILFFGLKEDLLQMLELVESEVSLTFVRMGNFLEHDINDAMRKFETGAALPNLGKASADSSAACDAFLVSQRECRIKMRRIRTCGADRVCIDQVENPNTIEFKPAGLWNDKIVLHGRIATVSESRSSQALMTQFETAIKKTFCKIKAFYVGPKALEFLKTGKRLTISVQSPPEFDLTFVKVK